jgi:lipopolysaccharide transport system ATP-binding protein
MNDRVAGSRIVVLASHNFQMLRAVCKTGLVLEHGRLVFNGPIKEAIAAYKDIYQPAAPAAARN